MPSIAADAIADAQLTAVADAERAADATNAILTAHLLAAGSTTGSTSSTEVYEQRATLLSHSLLCQPHLCGTRKASREKAKARVACSGISLHYRHWAKHPGISITWTLIMPKAYVLHTRTADLAFKHHVPIRICALVSVPPQCP